MATSTLKQEAMELIDSQVDDDQDVTEITELSLDSVHFAKFDDELKDKIESFTNLNVLTLNDCALKSLDNFPNIKNAVKIELIDNHFKAEELKKLPALPDLQSLSLGGNIIKNIDEIKCLKDKFPKLIEIDLIDCEIAKVSNYRDQVFSLFPDLNILDNCDKEGKEVEMDDEDEDIEFDDENCIGEIDDEENENEEGGDDEDDEDEDAEPDEAEEDSEEEVEDKPTKKLKK